MAKSCSESIGKLVMRRNRRQVAGLPRSLILFLGLLCGARAFLSVHVSWSSAPCAFKRLKNILPADEGTTLGTDSLAEVDEQTPSLGLVAPADSKSQLFSAFAALDLNDQYDAVLTGLCANRILDDAAISAVEARTALEDPLQLLQEMNRKRIPVSPRSLMALIDSAVKTQDARSMHTVLTLSRQNLNGLNQFGALQTEIQALPSNPNQKVKCADGIFKTRGERLDRAVAVPSDDREEEIIGAFLFFGLCGACFLTNSMSVESIAPLANLSLVSVMVIGMVDNFYELLQGLARLSQNGQKEKNNLPNKENLPFGLGTGRLTGKVVNGLTRLLTIDAERESQCEAAALFCAYNLGLACFAFRPNALEASALVIESVRNDGMSSLDNSLGYLKVLIWLLAPVCAESMKHSQLIMSNPREAVSFLDRLEAYESEHPGSLDGMWWVSDAKERQDLLTWAYAEAELMLRQNRGAVAEVAQSLTGGAATVGDCVAIMERW